MSTRSFIGIQNPEGFITGIYCHFDGYFEGVGETLSNHYTNHEKVMFLMDLGDLSSLGEEIGEPHDFNDCPEGQCNAYHRDRGEKKEEPIFFHDLQDLKSSGWNRLWAEYAYVWDGESWLKMRLR